MMIWPVKLVANPRRHILPILIQIQIQPLPLLILRLPMGLDKCLIISPLKYELWKGCYRLLLEFIIMNMIIYVFWLNPFLLLCYLIRQV